MTVLKSTFHPKRILLFNLLGLALALSWQSPHLLAWQHLDDIVFFATNAWLHDANTLWVTIVAVTNHRAFDAASFLTLLIIFLWAIRRDPVREHRLLRWGAIGITMLLTAGILSQAIRYVIPYNHPSPTLVHEGVNLVSQLVSFSTKDVSGGSFPGDHGLMLMLFTAFLWRFAGRTVGLVCIPAVVIFSAPRILSGAHWFSDVYMGALAISLVALPWVLCTPLAPSVARGITRGLVATKSWLQPAR